MVIAKRYIFDKKYEGFPTQENFKLVEEELPKLKDGEFLVEGIYFSVDPYFRLHSIEVGRTMIGTQVAKIIESKSSKFPVGKYVVGDFGWRTHSIWKDDVPRTSWDVPYLLPFTVKDAPLSLALGVLGMPGNTAYFGLFDVCQLKSGETVIVNTAGGAVGSLVGQIAKIKGCKVIGITGTDQKVEWVKSLGFDYVINYKKDDLKKALAEAAPNGIDCFFDNVGGEASTTIMKHMNLFGRVAVCGAISAYNSQDEEQKVTMVQLTVLRQRLTIRGFWIHEYLDRWEEGVLQNLKWFKEGKLKYKETITHGFNNLINALIGVLNGENIGKAIVKA